MIKPYSQPIDKKQLYDMASQAKENMQVGEFTAIADKGYYSAKQFEMSEKENIRSIVMGAKLE